MTDTAMKWTADTVPTVIASFAGEWRFLSNFTLCAITFEGREYSSVEHAYQAAKSLDDQDRLDISMFVRPQDARWYGRKIIKLRPDWEAVRLPIMFDLLWQKFTPGRLPDYHAGLLRTQSALLIEGNTWGDRFWGMEAMPDVGVGHWVGANWLGKLLMAVRACRRLRRQHAPQGPTPEVLTFEAPDWLAEKMSRVLTQ